MAISEKSNTLTSSATTTDRILDAAVACFQRSGIEKTTMSDVIQQSGMARTTVYRYFNVKDDIISQVVLRDIDYFVQHLNTVRNEHKDIEQLLVEILFFSINEMNNRPLLKSLFSQDPIHLSKLGLSNEMVMDYNMQASQPTYKLMKKSGRLRVGISLRDFSDWCGRIIMSFVIAPHQYQNNPKQMRLYIKKFIVPSLLTSN